MSDSFSFICMVSPVQSVSLSSEGVGEQQTRGKKVITGMHLLEAVDVDGSNFVVEPSCLEVQNRASYRSCFTKKTRSDTSLQSFFLGNKPFLFR